MGPPNQSRSGKLRNLWNIITRYLLEFWTLHPWSRGRAGWFHRGGPLASMNHPRRRSSRVFILLFDSSDADRKNREIHAQLYYCPPALARRFSDLLSSEEEEGLFFYDYFFVIPRRFTDADWPPWSHWQEEAIQRAFQFFRRNWSITGRLIGVGSSIGRRRSFNG